MIIDKMLRVIVPFAFAIGSASAATTCDRACLKTMLDQYLSAVVAHNPAAAPLSIGYRETENAIAMRPGSGMWQSAMAQGKLQRKYLDPVSEQAGYFGTVDEAAGPAIVTLRLKVEDRRITEAEWIISRKGDPGLGPEGGGQAEHAYHDSDYLLAHPPAERVVPKNERLSRTDLIAITNSYFDGLTAHNGKLIIAHPGCVREENGILTTQRDLPGGGKSDCTSENAMRNIFAVTARRYPIVDEEAGAVLCIGLFERRPGTTMRRNLLGEWFFIEHGKIRTVFAAMYYPDQNAMAPNWPPYFGNWPVPPIAK
jgi:hypothetical protein